MFLTQHEIVFNFQRVKISHKKFGHRVQWPSALLDIRGVSVKNTNKNREHLQELHVLSETLTPFVV